MGFGSMDKQFAGSQSNSRLYQKPPDQQNTDCKDNKQLTSMKVTVYLRIARNDK